MTHTNPDTWMKRTWNKAPVAVNVK
jgi:hypothetical protein